MGNSKIMVISLIESTLSMLLKVFFMSFYLKQFYFFHAILIFNEKNMEKNVMIILMMLE